MKTFEWFKHTGAPVRLASNAKKLRIGTNDVYGVRYSDDKQTILLAMQHDEKDLFTLSTKAAQHLAKYAQPFTVGGTPKPRPVSDTVTDDAINFPTVTHEYAPPVIKASLEEVKLLQHIGSEAGLYGPASSGLGKIQNELKIKWARKMHHKVNRLFFGGKLKEPTPIALSKDQGKFFTNRAYYTGRGEIFMAPRIFLAGDEAITTATLVHEMCHQAVDQIDNDFYDGGPAVQGHGPKWEAWMRKCMLTPSRYCNYDSQTFVPEKEKEEDRKRKERDWQYASSQHVRPEDIKQFLPVSFMLPGNSKIYTGILARPFNELGRRWIVITAPTVSQQPVIPVSMLRYAIAVDLKDIEPFMSSYKAKALKV